MNNRATEADVLREALFTALKGFTGSYFDVREKMHAARDAVFECADALPRRTAIDLIKTLVDQDNGVNKFVEKALSKLLDYAADGDPKTKQEITEFVTKHTSHKIQRWHAPIIERRDELVKDLTAKSERSASVDPAVAKVVDDLGQGLKNLPLLRGIELTKRGNSFVIEPENTTGQQVVATVDAHGGLAVYWNCATKTAAESNGDVAGNDSVAFQKCTLETVRPNSVNEAFCTVATVGVRRNWLRPACDI
jgi:hypothetical protein